MTILGLTLTVLISIVVMFGSRKAAALGIMAALCYITQYQSVEVWGFHFTAMRMALLAGMVRIIIRGELKGQTPCLIDWVVIAYPSVVTIVSILRIGTTEMLVYQLGVSYDILLSYLVFRYLLTNRQDVEGFLLGLAFLIVLLAISMIVESVTAKNLFAESGMIDDRYIREGRPRCQGSFRGPITAGIFGATLIPLFIGGFSLVARRLFLAVGVLSAMAITYTSNSSGPLMAFLTGLIGLALWPMRERMRIVQWGIAIGLLCLSFAMKAPVWYLIAKLSAIVGGDGWHRSYLMEQAIRHFSDWWLLGTSNTSDWMPYTMASGKADITNQYVASGVDGGLAGLILFVLIIVTCFRNLGIALKESRERFPRGEFFFWCLGSALFAHVFTFFSVAYFDQMHVAWWALLAMISSATANVLRHSSPKTVQP